MSTCLTNRDGNFRFSLIDSDRRFAVAIDKNTPEPRHAKFFRRRKRQGDGPEEPFSRYYSSNDDPKNPDDLYYFKEIIPPDDGEDWSVEIVLEAVGSTTPLSKSR